MRAPKSGKARSGETGATAGRETRRLVPLWRNDGAPESGSVHSLDGVTVRRDVYIRDKGRLLRGYGHAGATWSGRGRVGRWRAETRGQGAVAGLPQNGKRQGSAPGRPRHIGVNPIFDLSSPRVSRWSPNYRHPLRCQQDPCCTLCWDSAVRTGHAPPPTNLMKGLGIDKLTISTFSMPTLFSSSSHMGVECAGAAYQSELHYLEGARSASQ